MATNPVFSRFNRDLSQGKYAGIGRQQPQFGQHGQAAPYNPPPRDAYGPPPGQYGQQGQFAQQGYGGPQAGPTYAPQAPEQTGRAMTLDDVVMRTLILFGLLVASGAVAWFVAADSQPVGLGLWLGGMVIGLVLGLVIAFKKTVSVPLILAYAVVEGAFVGACSQFFNTMWPGVVGEAVLGTVCVFVAMFAGWKFGLIRVTDRSRKIFGMAVLGYVLFSVVNVVLQMTGVLGGFGFFDMGAIGIALCLIGIALAAYSLAVDFDSITRATQAGLPEKYAWLMAHGLIVTVVWLYLELLRLLARLRN